MTHTGILVLALSALAAPLLATQAGGRPAAPIAEAQRPQDNAAQAVDRLRAELYVAGAEGLAQREQAIEHLLSLPSEAAHAALCERLLDADDPDLVRVRVLESLVRRLRNPIDPVFGSGQKDARRQLALVALYAKALLPFWFDERAIESAPPGPLGGLARQCIMLMPARTLIAALRAIVVDAQADMPMRLAALRAAGDSQDLLFADFLAEHLVDEDAQIRGAARTALRYLTFRDATFESRDQYDSWRAQNAQRTYVELAEEAARRGARRDREHQEQLAAVRTQAAAEVVYALTEKRKGIDWARVQQRALVDDPAVLRACLEQLRGTLADATFADDGAARTAFVRALLQRYQKALTQAVDGSLLPALLLEVAALSVRPSDSELAGEVAAELLAQTKSGAGALQAAALRGLRRFPSPEARAAIVELALACLSQLPERDSLLSLALQTLATAGDNPWRAPSEAAADRMAWLLLVRSVCLGDLPRERRNEGVAVALQLDREGKRVLEAFDLLLEIANDPAREPDYRTACLISLQGWRDHPTRASVLIQALASLLGDAERDVRLFAADSLARLPDAPEEQKRSWIGTITAALRERLQTEMNSAVQRSMLACLVASSRDPGSPEAAIGALNVALDGIRLPVPEEQQPRTLALLQTLTEIAADPRANQGQWIGACEMLLRHERRRMLRHVLVSHNAVQLAREVRSQDASLAQRARSAMRYLLLAALQKPQAESWQSSDELRQEARDVRTAFESLPPGAKLPESIDAPAMRLLRLECLLATDNLVEVAALGKAYLDDKAPAEYEALSVVQQDAVCFLMAEAHLRGGRLPEAVAALARVQQATGTDPRMVDFAERIGRGYLATDAAKAVEWLQSALAGTAEESPAFRTRFALLWQAKVKADPQQREAALAEIERRAALFDAPDCPEEARQAIAQLRGDKKRP